MLCWVFVVVACACNRRRAPSLQATDPKERGHRTAAALGTSVQVGSPSSDGSVKRAEVDEATSAPNTLYRLVGNLAGNGTVDGRANQARFTQPYDVTSDGEGSLYVADSKNNAIRKVELASGTVTTLAGAHDEPGSVDGDALHARFRGPHGLVSDGLGS